MDHVHTLLDELELSTQQLDLRPATQSPLPYIKNVKDKLRQVEKALESVAESVPQDDIISVQAVAFLLQHINTKAAHLEQVVAHHTAEASKGPPTAELSTTTTGKLVTSQTDQLPQNRTVRKNDSPNPIDASVSAPHGASFVIGQEAAGLIAASDLFLKNESRSAVLHKQVRIFQVVDEKRFWSSDKHGVVVYVRFWTRWMRLSLKARRGLMI